MANVWMTHLEPVGKDQLEYCKKKSRVAIGWPGLNLSNEDWEATDIAKKETGHARRQLREFRKMKPGDLVLVCRRDYVHRATITGGIQHSKDTEDKELHCANYFPAEWEDGTWERPKDLVSLNRGHTHRLVSTNRADFEARYCKKQETAMANVWMTRLKPVGKDQRKYCKDKGIVAIGWPGLDLSAANWEDTAEQLNLSGYAKGRLREFRRMEKDDLVLVPRDGLLYRATIKGGIQPSTEDKDQRNHCANYFAAEWEKGTWERAKMPARIQSRLKYRGAHLDLCVKRKDLEARYG